MNLLYVLILGFAVSLDSFAAGVSYGLKNIRMPLRSLATVGLVTAVCTGISMLFAKLIDKLIDVHTAVIVGSILLVSLGLFNIIQEYLTKDHSLYNMDNPSRRLCFSVGKLVISIMAKPEAADMDQSKSISPIEALFLGLALGIDNMVATLAASLIEALPLYTPLLMGLIQMLFVATGRWASCRLVSDTFKNKVPYLPGTILILIGLMRLG